MNIQKRIRIKEFCQLLGRKRSTFDRWRKNGKIPKQDGNDPYPYWLEYNVKKFIETLD
ncbi:MAG: transcriptional regulator [Moraxella sp.]|nr:transcriptional regulator [Moraxella sp.]